MLQGVGLFCFDGSPPGAGLPAFAARALAGYARRTGRAGSGQRVWGGASLKYFGSMGTGNGGERFGQHWPNRKPRPSARLLPLGSFLAVFGLKNGSFSTIQGQLEVPQKPR
jgi:hypothetical protein